MKTLKTFVAIAVMAIIALSMFNACKKENLTKGEIQNISMKQQKSTDFPSDILAFIDEYVAGGYVNEEHTVTGENGLVYSLFTTDEEWRLLEWIEEQEAEEKTVQIFEHNSGLQVWISWEQHEHFILMTEEERQYLIEHGSSLSIDEFTLNARQLVSFITEGSDLIFVAAVVDNDVYFMGIDASGSTSSWYNRLHEHFINHHPIDPDNLPLDGCIVANDENEEDMKAFWEWVQNAEKLEYEDGIGYTLVKEYDEEGNLWWKGCNGMCSC